MASESKTGLSDGIDGSPRLIRVLVVDDSAFARKTIRQILSRSPFIEVVGIAGDGEEALGKVAELHPDVVTLDLMMPGLDGLGFLTRQMASSPLPILVVSTVSDQHGMVLKAFEAGAVDFVHKPSTLASEAIFEMSEELVEKVKAAGAIGPRQSEWNRSFVEAAPPPAATHGNGSIDAIVIGISTGGPQALKLLIPQFAADFPVPIAIVLHMPLGFTEIYAAKLDDISRLKVVEAAEGRPLLAGMVMLAPAGQHLTFRRNGNDCLAHLDVRPFDTPHRPSVDVLFQSAAEVFGKRLLGIVMTGMGSDGKLGAASIKAQGGRVFTESEETCVVYGMPSTVAEAGMSDRSVRLDRMAEAILEVV